MLMVIILIGCELTGDTVTFGNNAWGDAKNAAIMYETCFSDKGLTFRSLRSTT